VSDSYDPEFGTGANAQDVHDALEAVRDMLAAPLPKELRNIVELAHEGPRGKAAHLSADRERAARRSVRIEPSAGEPLMAGLQGKGFRIVKPRSAKQRAHFARLKTTASATPFAAPPAWTAPTSSWWAGATREELRERVLQEQPRIALSRFGRIVGSGVIPPG
jgi:hypothetical protein